MVYMRLGLLSPWEAVVVFVFLYYIPGVEAQTPSDCVEMCGTKDCPDVYNPVCASNNETYSNDCVFTCALCRSWKSGSSGRLSIVHRGVCECSAPKDCTDDYKPVCGTDNNDYANMCQLTLANNCRTDINISVKYEGSCEPDPADPLCQSKMICAAMYAPVCGTDGRTYGNVCLFYAANVCRPINDRLEVSYHGECRSLLKTWMAIAIVTLVVLALVLFCCIYLLRKTKNGGSRHYNVHGRDKEEL